MRYALEISHDFDAENPNEDGWGLVLYSFGSRHVNYRDPADFFLNGGEGRPKTWLANKLRAKTAFLLSYHEHGSCVWSLSGEGLQCRWDTVSFAGVLVWEGKPGDWCPLEDRKKSARGWLEYYTDWCNGNCFWYTLETENGDLIDSCAGFVGSDAVLEAVAEALPPDATDENTDVKGLFDASDIRWPSPTESELAQLVIGEGI